MQRLLTIDPRAKGIVSSGYSNDPVMADHALHGFSGVIAKPYSIRGLDNVIAEGTRYFREYGQRMKEQEIIDGLKVICKCRDVRKSVFLKHIRAGASTVEALKKATGAGTGTCKGKQCTPKIEDLLKELNK